MPPSVTPVERVAANLRQEIISGDLMPGTRLKDHELAERFGISRNTLREAVRRLQSAGLVEVRRNAGAAVRTIDKSGIQEIFAVRRALELTGVRCSVDAPPAAIASLNQLVAIAAQAQSKGDFAEQRRAGLLFHKALVAFNGSSQLNEFFDNIVAQLRLALNELPLEARSSAYWHERDSEIALLISQGEHERAGLLLEKYLFDSEMLLIDFFDAKHSEREPHEAIA